MEQISNQNFCILLIQAIAIILNQLQLGGLRIWKFQSIWRTIANRFKDYPPELLFEVVNEPYFELSAEEMDQLNALIISVIRSTGGNNADRNLIIVGGGENSYLAPQQISSSILASDDQLIATFHYYDPFSFTSSQKDQYDDNDWGQ